MVFFFCVRFRYCVIVIACSGTTVTSAFYIVDATILRYIMYFVFEAHHVLVIMAPVSTRDVQLLESYIYTHTNDNFGARKRRREYASERE